MPGKNGTPWKIATTILAGAVILLTVLLLYNKRKPAPAKPIPTPTKKTPLPKPINKGEIVFIIDDFGYRNDKVADGFLTLDAPMTYAIIPGHRYSQSFGQAASQKGYEVIIHMPIESRSESKGETEYRLNTGMSEKQVDDRLGKAFTELFMAVGMNNHQGSKGTENKSLMTALAKYLRKKGAYFIDSRTTAKSVAEEVMRENNVPTGHRAVFLDNDSDPDLIKTQIGELTEKARHYGFAIGIGHVRPNTLEVLKKEIPRLEKEGYKLLYASQGVG